MGQADRIDHEELRTPRLSLRRPTSADIDTIHRIHRAPRAYAHNPADALDTRAEAEKLYDLPPPEAVGQSTRFGTEVRLC
ncbi:hypothetical protein ACGFIK_00785 [Micromonospora sp. NPDC048871]|uniref:hypothetical protein n=1 Tax=unclassified Micromonospora TaxID=2617518 RepID=UPI002E0D5457|nr:hypothetical protein OIE53_14575 [Micromonospora sp. NBC_01739]